MYQIKITKISKLRYNGTDSKKQVIFQLYVHFCLLEELLQLERTKKVRREEKRNKSGKVLKNKLNKYVKPSSKT